MLEQTAPKPRRHWPRFSVRMLMTFVLITGLGLGWIALVTCQALVQSYHVAQIKGIGGRVMYDWEWRNGMALPPSSVSPWRQWLIAHLGPDFVGEPIALSVGSRGKLADDALMAHVGRLGRLEYLSLSDTAVSDAGLAELQAAHQVEESCTSRSPPCEGLAWSISRG